MAERAAARLAGAALPGAVPAVLLLLAEGAARAGLAPRAIPAPARIAAALIDRRALLWHHLEPTLLTASTGLLLALAIALALAALVHLVKPLEPAAVTAATVVESVPMIALAPVLVIWLGLTLPMRITIVTIICVFPIFVAVLQGLKAASAPLEALFVSLAATPLQRFRLLSFPAALPYLFVGLKIAAPLAILGALIAEWTGAERGLGVYLFEAMFALKVAALWAGVVVACMVSASAYLLVCLFERLSLGDAGRVGGGSMEDVAAPAPAGRLAGAGRIAAGRIAGLAGFLLVGGLAWQAAAGLFAVPAYLLPAPPAVLGALGAHAGAVAAAAAFTLACTIAGMAISVAVAVALAVAFTASEPLGRALMPLVVAVRTVPVIAVAPLVVVVFGRGPGNGIGMVALLTFFQVMLPAWRGFLAPPASALELMHGYGAGFWQTQRKVRLPFAIPYIFTGLRIAAGSAILCAMFAEWLSGAPGLGTLILDAYSTHDFPLMWAAVLTSTVAAYLFFTATLCLERLVADRRG